MGFYKDQKDWKILNVDCSSSEVTTRQMTDEEKSKYGLPVKSTKIKLGDEAYMAKLKITTEELLEDCKEFGMDWQACATIGAKRGITQKQVSNLIVARGIKKLIVDEKLAQTSPKKECTEHKDCEIKQHKGYQEHSLGLPSKEEFSKVLESVIVEGNAVSEPVGVVSTLNDAKKCISADFANLDEREKTIINIKKGFEKGVTFTDLSEVKTTIEYKPRLRPKSLLSQTFPYEYGLYDEALVIRSDNNPATLSIGWDELDDFIEDLQEVKRIVNE